jgi:hypothetical protein
MQGFGMLKRVVSAVTIVLKRVKHRDIFPSCNLKLQGERKEYTGKGGGRRK